LAAIQQMGMTTVAQCNAVIFLADIYFFTFVGDAQVMVCCLRLWCCASCHRTPLGSRQLLLPPPPPSSNRCLAYLQGPEAVIDNELVWVKSKPESKGMARCNSDNSDE